MGTGIFYPVDGADDGYAGIYNDTGMGAFDATSYYELYGFDTDYGWDFHWACRFRSVNIPKGATITECFLRAYAGYSVSTPANFILHFKALDDGTQPANSVAWWKTALTTGTDWLTAAGQTAGAQYDTPDIKDELQAIVDRDGWVSGNAATILIKNRTLGTGGKRSGCFIEDFWHGEGAGSSKAELHVTWTVAPQTIEETLEGVAGINASFEGLVRSMNGDLSGNVGVNADFDGSSLSETLQVAAGVRMALSRTIEIPRSMAATAGVLADFDGFNWSDFLRVYRDRISIRYLLTLSDGILEDLIIPISSFQGRFRSGDPTFLSVVIPGNDLYADIAARDEGDLILTMQYLIGGVVYHSEEICTVDLEDIRIDEGASSVSVGLSGHRTVTNTAKTTQLSGASYKAVSDGKIRYRCTPELYLRPGDTVIVGDDTFTAGVISWTVDPSQQTMEVEEA